MRRAGCLVALAGLALTPAARAHPGAAPWEADARSSSESCASCHFDAEPVRGSGALSLDGLPETIEAGRLYELTLRLKHAGMKVAGFLIAAADGEFVAGPGVETQANKARSTLEAAKQTDAAHWRFSWRAPKDARKAPTFYLSANAGNDDQSPFGDTIYLDVVKAK